MDYINIKPQTLYHKTFDMHAWLIMLHSSDIAQV